MRYIGNKTKLLTFIGDFLQERGIEEGRVLDAFAGTAAVGSYLKSKGFSVTSCDIMSFSYVFQRAYIVADEYPRFKHLRDERFNSVRAKAEFKQMVAERFAGQGDLFTDASSELRPLEEVLVYLDTYLRPRRSFITENFSATDETADGERMYFTRENARRIDAIRHQLHEWKTDDVVSEDEFYILLATLIEAADAVANTTGVYAAYVKTWQGNAVKPLKLSVPPLVVGSGLTCEAFQGDANVIVEGLGYFDLVYLDPPYNTRQYSAYYHVPEIIAEGWFDAKPVLRGKTGLVPDSDKKSDWSTKEGCMKVLEEFVATVQGKHLLMSYNNEGIIPEDEIERVFRSSGLEQTYVRTGQEYARYRSDRDHETRQYKADSTTEHLYYVQLQ